MAGSEIRFVTGDVILPQGNGPRAANPSGTENSHKPERSIVPDSLHERTVPEEYGFRSRIVSGPNDPNNPLRFPDINWSIFDANDNDEDPKKIEVANSLFEFFMRQLAVTYDICEKLHQVQAQEINYYGLRASIASSDPNHYQFFVNDVLECLIRPESSDRHLIKIELTANNQQRWEIFRQKDPQDPARLDEIKFTINDGNRKLVIGQTAGKDLWIA